MELPNLGLTVNIVIFAKAHFKEEMVNITKILQNYYNYTTKYAKLQ